MKTLALFVATAALAASAFGQGLINRRAPSFSLPDSAFTQFDILDYRGKWLLIEFMQTNAGGCPTCRDLTKKLEALKTKHGSKIAVLSIVTTPPETQQTAAAYIAETKTTIPILFDASMVAMAYFKATPQRPAIDVPHIFAVNPQGSIVRDWSKALADAAAFSGEIDKLIAGLPDAVAPAAKEAPAKADTKAKTAKSK
ncbi:MAG: TlpA disulfide reductase family protein [Acidobacteriota bacterium]